MTQIRELIDQNHTLPVIRLETIKSDDFGYLLRDHMNIVAEDEVIGKLDLVSETKGAERFAHFDGIEVNEELRGRGIGLAAYVLAIEVSHARYFDFQTQNYELTEHSKKVWEHLAAAGVAEVVDSFIPSRRFEGRYVGKYRVPMQR